MVSKVVKLLKDMPAKSCELDPVPTWLLKLISSYIAPTICQLCNLSLERGVFPAQLKQAHVLPLLKKLSLDPDVATSYRPISNLSYLSKLIERVVVILVLPSIYPPISFCLSSSLPIDHIIRLKRLQCQSTMTLSAPSTMATSLS